MSPSCSGLEHMMRSDAGPAACDDCDAPECYTGPAWLQNDTVFPHSPELVLTFLSFINLNIYTLQFCSPFNTRISHPLARQRIRSLVHLHYYNYSRHVVTWKPRQTRIMFPQKIMTLSVIDLMTVPRDPRVTFTPREQVGACYWSYQSLTSFKD